MSVQRIASRYAKALLDFATEENKLEEVMQDVLGFQKAVKNRDFYLLLKSPVVNRPKKMQIFDALFHDSSQSATLNFFKIMLNKGREQFLPEISEEFLKQYKVQKHISAVRLTTAQPLSEEYVRQIKQKLLASTATGDSIELERVVDPSLIGGFQIEMGDKLFDASLKHKLALMQKEFVGNVYEKAF